MKRRTQKLEIKKSENQHEHKITIQVEGTPPSHKNHKYENP
jgi:hypothetical protein